MGILARSSVLVCLATGWGSLLLAQASGTEIVAKVGFIDVERVAVESKAGQEELARLKNVREQKTAEGETLKQEAQDLQTQIDDGRLSLPEGEMVELEKQLEDKMLALRRFADDAERVLQKEQEQAFARIEREVMPIIARVSEEQGFTLVFNKWESGLIYATEQADITDLILKLYDASVTEKE